ncbi:hypothetical protein GO986_00030 [Deinococcus sp. HMF7620]|uniref:Uncharacterized protein n=1 Tax=Deinococcus arboris TaxID=2682977 RepID=A0A7C9M5Z3_9DEIO|nr:hypothetical protein [Deinococcus arboris]MVN85159.1 hypothetical protein [Deinococcus arboris]
MTSQKSKPLSELEDSPRYLRVIKQIEGVILISAQRKRHDIVDSDACDCLMVANINNESVYLESAIFEPMHLGKVFANALPIGKIIDRSSEGYIFEPGSIDDLFSVIYGSVEEQTMGSELGVGVLIRLYTKNRKVQFRFGIYRTKKASRTLFEVFCN